MQKILVNNETLRIITIPGSAGKKLHLKPGTQYVDLDTWKQVQKEAKYHLDLENISLPESKSEDDLAEGLTGYKVKDAVELVKASTDEEVLADWKKIEEGQDKPRAGVLKAIDDQLKALKDALKTGDE